MIAQRAHEAQHTLSSRNIFGKARDARSHVFNALRVLASPTKALFGKVAAHGSRGTAESITVGAHCIRTNTSLQVAEILHVLHTAQEGDHLIQDGHKVHRVSSLPGARPPCPCATPS